jgi:hypothetical protein
MSQALQSYMQTSGQSQVAFARSIGTSQAHVSRLVSGAMPSLPLAITIERVTGGAVPVSSWADTTEAPGSKG